MSTLYEDDLFDEEDLSTIADELLEPRSETGRSSICAVLWGSHDTAKSGIALDSRTPEQIKDHHKIYVIDLDDANEPLWRAHWNSTPDIVIVNPVIWLKNPDKKEIDYDRTIKMLNILAVKIHDKVVLGEKVASVVFDGLDKLLDTAENQMRMDHQLEVDQGVTFAFWRKRNKYFLDIMKAMKLIPCAKYFITHEKNYEKKKNDKVIKEWTDGNWQRNIPNEMWQIVRCKKDMNADGTTTYTAQIQKFKGKPELVGAEFTILSVEKGKPEWNGLECIKSDAQ